MGNISVWSPAWPVPVMVMPMAGAGMFGMTLGMMAPVMTWGLHLVFSAVMGMTYGRQQLDA